MSYTLTELLANPKNYGATRWPNQIKYLVYHYTGNAWDTAENNAKYYRTELPAEKRASAHYFVDDREVYRSVPELCVAYSVGGKRWSDWEQTGGGSLYGVVNNANSLSIEMCGTAGGNRRESSEATINNALDLGRALMAKYDIPIERVCRHFDVTGKYCPAWLMDENRWEEFRRRLQLDNYPAVAHEAGVYWCREKGILQGNAAGDLMLSQPVTRQQLCTFLKRFYDLMERE